MAEIDTLVARLHAAVARLGGRVIGVAADASLRLYANPSDPQRAARRTPTEAVVKAQYPTAHVELVERHGYVLLSVPNERRSFGLLPPRAAAQVTSALGEHGRAWVDVVADRDAGRGGFGWTMFAASDVSDVHGWAFDREGQVWLVESGAPEHRLGSLEHWLAERIAALESLEILVAPDDDDDDFYPGPSSLDGL